MSPMILLHIVVFLPFRFNCDREVSGVSKNVSYQLSRQVGSFDQPDAVPGTLFVGPISVDILYTTILPAMLQDAVCLHLRVDETRCQESYNALALSRYQGLCFPSLFYIFLFIPPILPSVRSNKQKSWSA